MTRLTRHALEHGGADVRHGEHLHGADARHARDVAELEEHERDGRQDEVVQTLVERRAIRWHRRDGQPLEPHREDVEEHDAADELGDDRHRQRGDRDRPVQDAVSSEAGEHAERDRYGHDDDECEAGEDEGVPEGVEDQWPHRHLQQRRFAPVAGDEAACPRRVAHDQRPVGAELLVEQLDLFFSGVGPQDGASHVAGQHLRKREDQHRRQDQRRDHEEEPASDESQHPGALTSVRFRDPPTSRGGHEAHGSGHSRTSRGPGRRTRSSSACAAA